MFLIIKYIVLIILSYQCITIYSFKQENVKNNYNNKKYIAAEGHCVISFPSVNQSLLPIPYRPNASGAATFITPDRHGHLFIGHKERFRFSCSGTKFVRPAVCAGLYEVTVECLNGSTVGYDGGAYEFDSFRCKVTPTAKLTAANASCNDIVDGVFNVGYAAKGPLSLYRVCYDVGLKRTLYSWRYVDAPTFDGVPVSETKPRFTKSEHFLETDMGVVFELKTKIETEHIEKKSTKENRIRINNRIQVLIPGQLLTRNQFVYSYQQSASFFYENTAPQWSVFSRSVWREVEKLFLRNLNRARGKHLILAGTMNSTHTIPWKTYTVSPLVRRYSEKIPIPVFIWTMIYNVRNKEGIVYIGLNSPLMRDDPTKHFCEKTPCPGKFGRQIAGMDMVHCCSKESFETFYGPLEPVVFEEF